MLGSERGLVLIVPGIAVVVVVGGLYWLGSPKAREVVTPDSNGLATSRTESAFAGASEGS